MSETNLSRREELLADAALAELASSDEAAFEALVRDTAARAEFAALERTAAMVSSYGIETPAEDPDQTMARLMAKLQADAWAYFVGRAEPRATTATPPDRGAPPGARWRLAAPWLLAAALAVALAWPRGASPRSLSPQQARAELLSAGHAVVHCDWRPGSSPRAGALSGDVVWDPVRQEGFLRLRSLPPLPPTQSYQLWIVDKKREGPPVDGGRLARTTTQDGEVVLPVAARLPVQHAGAFVLTIEADIGAVVSAQRDVVAIATP